MPQTSALSSPPSSKLSHGLRQQLRDSPSSSSSTFQHNNNNNSHGHNHQKSHNGSGPSNGAASGANNNSGAMAKSTFHLSQLPGNSKKIKHTN